MGQNACEYQRGWISKRKETNLRGIVWYGAGELGESVYGEKADIGPLGDSISGTFTVIILRILGW